MELEGTSMEMPQEMAQKLLADGAFLIIVDVPSETEIGMDLSTQKVGEMFRGFKMIPEGPHFVYSAAGDSALRVGFIHYFHKHEIILYEWDGEKEELRLYPHKDLERQKVRIKENIQELDKYLAPYDFENLRKWQLLTNDITEETIKTISPESGIVRTSAEFLSISDADRPKGQSPLQRKIISRINQNEDDLLPDMAIVPGTYPRFTKIPPLCRKDASPSEISLSHLDSIQAIDEYFNRFSTPIEAIKEIQFAFVLYLAGWSVDALAHWRKILALLSNSEIAIGKYKQIFTRYLNVLNHQLPELPEELMTQSDNNSVFKDVGLLIKNCSNCSLKHEADALRAHLKNTMIWTFDEFFFEDPDDLPVVVEL